MINTIIDYYLKGLPFDTRQEIWQCIDNIGSRAMENCLQAQENYPDWRSIGYSDEDIANRLKRISERLSAVNDSIVRAERNPLFSDPKDTYLSAKEYFHLITRRQPQEVIDYFGCTFDDYWPEINRKGKRSAKIEQFVMAYGVEHDRLRAIVPEGFDSIRPVIRINAEIIDGDKAYVEVNTAVASSGKKGWRNIKVLKDVTFEKSGNLTRFNNSELDITFTRIGIKGGCPAEKDNDGCFYIDSQSKYFLPAEEIDAFKEFCDCRFQWKTYNGTSGESIGKTLPAIPEGVKKVYPSRYFDLYSAASIPCRQVLGAYVVEFER